MQSCKSSYNLVKIKIIVVSSGVISTRTLELFN